MLLAIVSHLLIFLPVDSAYPHKLKKVADALLLSYRPRTGRSRSCTSSPSALRDSTTELRSGLESGCWESDPRLRTIEDDCGRVSLPGRRFSY